ncbi:MAG: inositol monophosphatase [Chitinophagales bacterium]|nr:inositol monophosphatase [Chitinophagales bacterium]
MINLKHILYDVLSVVQNAGQFIRQETGNITATDVETKSLNSLVTFVDKQAEQILVKGLQKIIPASTFLTEENTIAEQQGEYKWIIDSLDGTTNFIHAIPVFAVSVALQYRNQTILGVVLEVNRNECFYAITDDNAYCNQQIIKVSNTKNLQDSLIATGFPYYDYQHTKAYLDTLYYFMKNTRGMRRLGAAAVDLAYVACGRFDAFFEYSLAPWDVAAGAFIVQQADGQVLDFHGKDNYLFGKTIIASNALLDKAMLQTIQQYFNIS